jgi:uncharacterized protein YdaU (DUF1376 family)
MKRPWMPLYVGDYLGDTGHLTTTQHGAYLLLMMHYWRKDGLPDDDRQLAKITKLPFKIWTEYRDVLQDFFYDGWHHKRIDAELRRMMTISEKRAIAGQLGGNCSALSRMHLGNVASGKSNKKPLSSVPTKNAWLNNEQSKPLKDQQLGQAIAKQTGSSAAAIVDHSHSQSKKEEGKQDGSLATALIDSALREPREERKQEASNGPVAKPASQLNRSELEAAFQKRKSWA